MHRTLRRIPSLRNLPSRELEDLQDRMVYRFYPASAVIWRTHGPLRFSGYLRSGEIELEYRVDGVTVRTMRIWAGDPLPPRTLQGRKLHGTMIATAVTDIRIGILPEVKQAAAKAPASGGKRWLWPVLLFLLIVVLARNDLVRIASGLFYLASGPAESSATIHPRSIGLLHAAQKVDSGAAFAYNEEGYRQFQQGRLSDAEAAFVQAVNRDPASAPALNNLAITYFTRGDYSQAAQYLRQSVEQDPNNPVAPYNLGITLMELQDPTGAIREFREAGFIDPKVPLPALQQAYLYQQQGDYAAAEQRALTAIQLNPSLAPAHLLLGLALYNQGQETDALDAFKETLALEPGNRAAAFYQALILGHQKEYDVALPILRGLLVSSPNPAESARIMVEIDALYRFKAELIEPDAERRKMKFESKPHPIDTP